MKRILQDERGIALAVAIFALVVVGALVAGAFFAGTQEQRVADNQRRVQQSFGVAEAGVTEQLVTWTTVNNRRGVYWASAAPRDSIVVRDTIAPGGTGRYAGTVYRVGTSLFLVDVIGRDTRSAGGTVGAGGGARQRIGLLTRLAPVEFDIRASLTTQGGVNVQGNAAVNGFDQNPTGWASCGLPGMPMAGVRDQGGTVTTGGNGMVTGSPPVMNDPTLHDTNFTQFRGTSYAQLAAKANVTLPGGNYKTEPVANGATCDRSVLTNWGDGDNPLAPCGDYFPIIHMTGNTTLNGVQGQGILLVDGNLDVQGSYQFYGIVIIQGDLSTAGGGSTEAHFWGGVMAKNANLSVQNITGRATMNYSSCSILNALQMSSTPAMMRSRGWVQLY